MYGLKVIRFFLLFLSVKGMKNFLLWNLEVWGVCRVYCVCVFEWGWGKMKGVLCYLVEIVVWDLCYLLKKINYDK